MQCASDWEIWHVGQPKQNLDNLYSVVVNYNTVGMKLAVTRILVPRDS
jgi:hypothetical protein